MRGQTRRRALTVAVAPPRRRYPKPRYIVAPDALIFHTLAQVLLPDRVFDAFCHWLLFNDGWKYIYKA